MSTCHCFRGKPGGADYKPQGIFSKIGGANVYQSAPDPPVGKTKCSQNILFCPDGFGLATHNVQLADIYAAQGYITTLVDYFEGDALPDCFMKYTPGTDLDAYNEISAEEKSIIRKIDMPAWQSRHRPGRIMSVLDNFMPAYLASTPGKKHLVGHCFGGKPVFRLAKVDGNFLSAVIFHPAAQNTAAAFLEPSDLEHIKIPVLLGCAETDVFTPTLSIDMLRQLPLAGCSYKLTIYSGTKHGFASRADPENKEEVKKFQDALHDGLAWLTLHG